MPKYDYRCRDCGVFEMYAGRDEREVECACGNTATRLPFSGVPYLKGETVTSAIPDPEYKHDAEVKQFTNTWGTAERSMEMIRASVRTDAAKASEQATGFKQVDQKNMEALS